MIFACYSEDLLSLLSLYGLAKIPPLHSTITTPKQHVYYKQFLLQWDRFFIVTKLSITGEPALY